MLRKNQVLCFVFVALGFCNLAHSTEDDNKKPLVDDKYRLTKDREEFDKLRTQVPEEKRKENDEIAFVLGLMSELRLQPSEVREKFNTALRKKRESFNNDMKKNREQYVKNEKIDRDKFMKDLDSERKQLRSQKMSNEERREQNGNLENKRREFYSAQKEKRDEFEANIRDQRKNFEDYAREKTNDFNQEHRAYSKRYNDFKKEKEDERKNRESQANQIQSAQTREGQIQSSHSNSGVKPSVKVMNPTTYGITNEDLEKAFKDAKSKPANSLEPGQ